MGLDVSHDCWSGSYSRFMQFRRAIADSLGFDIDEMKGFDGQKSWEGVCSDGWKVLLYHSDCEGEISVEESKLLLSEMTSHLEKFKAHAPPWVDRYVQFMNGVKDAVDSNEEIDFH